MKNRFRYGLIGILGVLLSVSCYRDKGNYSYDNLNEISIDLPDVVSVQQGKVLNVPLKLTFALKEHEDNLSYEWVISIPTNADSLNVVLSKERDFSEQIDYAAGNSYPFSVKVTDHTTGVTYRKGMRLQVQTNFQPGYFILEQYADRGDISFYNTGTRVTYHNVFSQENPGVVLKPDVTNLFSIDYNGYSVSLGTEVTKVAGGNFSMIFGADWGYVFDYRTFRVISGIEQLFSTRPVVIRPQVLAMDVSPNFFLMNNGKIHRMYQAQGQMLFGDEFMTPDGSDYSCAPFIGPGYSGIGILFFDQLNHCFYKDNQSLFFFPDVSQCFKKDESGQPTTEVLLDAAKIDAEWEMIGMAQGGSMGLSYFIVFREQEQIYVAYYSINMMGFNGGSLQTVKEENCPGMRTSPVFVSPTGRSQVYYGNGSEIRLYDLSANTSRVVYTFPNGENVVDIVLPASDGLSMAAATYDGSKGSVYTFNLVNTGDLKDPLPISSETGFGKIKKLVYKK